MSSDSDDDAPLATRGNTKGAANAPAIKQEGGAAKPAAVKAEVKVEQETGVKGVQSKEKPNDAKAKGQEKKPPVAKVKAEVKEEEPAHNGKPSAATKKVKEEGKQPKEKKEYDMPGQTRDPPSETDSLRKFYTSLLEQRPESEIAKKWCLTHGLLSREAAEELVAQMKKSKPAVKSPAKSAARSESKTVVTKTRRPAEKAPAAKRQRQAISPPKKTRAKYSDEEEDASSSSSSEEDDDDDDEPIGRAKVVAKPTPKPAPKPALKAAPKATAARPVPVGAKPKGREMKALRKVFMDGGLDESDEDEDDNVPLFQRKK